MNSPAKAGLAPPRTVTWLSLGQAPFSLCKDLRSLVYSKLNNLDKYMVRMAHHPACVPPQSSHLDVMLSCVTKGHVELLDWFWKTVVLSSKSTRNPSSYDFVWHMAAARGNMSLLEWAHRASIPLEDNVPGVAARHGRLDALRWLIEHGYPINYDKCILAAMSVNPNSEIVAYLENMRARRSQ